MKNEIYVKIRISNYRDVDYYIFEHNGFKYIFTINSEFVKIRKVEDKENEIWLWWH